MGLLRGVARTAAVAGTATAVSNRVSRRQAARWSDQEAQSAPPEQYVPEQYAPPAPPPDDTDVKLAQLSELARLHKEGVLTDIEFEVQKSHILHG